MIEMRRAQLSFGDRLIAEEVNDLREEWMPYADQVLADGEIVGGGVRGMTVLEMLSPRRYCVVSSGFRRSTRSPVNGTPDVDNVLNG